MRIRRLAIALLVGGAAFGSLAPTAGAAAKPPTVWHHYATYPGWGACWKAGGKLKAKRHWDAFFCKYSEARVYDLFYTWDDGKSG
ncbi:hypothetical protein ACIBG8_36365 [Nonomuraea sp. NPDC050556]|uniref:hypothetical protein n=1 Tax=Nonomuraea sp. NPDC050556 TaxID=3364369 RepID=UPI00379169A6